MTPQAALVAIRFCNDIALLLLFGSSLFVAFQAPGALAASLSARLGSLRMGLACVAAAAAVTAVFAQTAMIGDGWGDALQPSKLSDVMNATSAGEVFLLQAGGFLAILLFTFAAAPWCWRGTALASGMMLAALALQGHAVMQDGTLGLIHQANDALHVLAAGAWFGALLPLAMILRSAAAANMPAHESTALRRFSVTGHLAVALVLATGLANTLFILGWPPAGMATYQMLLVAKIALVLLMVSLALLNRYVFVPSLRQDPARASKALLRGTFSEIVLGTLVILLVATFGMLDPA